MQTDSFEKYLKNKLSAAEFEKLPKQLKVSQHKLTRIINRPEEATLKVVLKLSEVLSKEPTELIDRFRLGFQNITLSDYEAHKAA